MSKRIKAFTLVELLATIVIIAIIGGIGVIGYRSFFKTGEERFYENVENDIMLAGNDYFIDHRSELPAGNEISEVELNDLITKKYIEPVKDSKGNDCTVGRVVAYRDGNQYKYVACLKCGDYETDNEYCKGTVTRAITMSGKTKNDAGSYVNYDVTASFNSAAFAKRDVVVTFSMSSATVKKYEIENTTTHAKDSCNASNSTCSITVKNTGTYKVTAYDSSNSIVATNQYMNVKIQRYNEDDPLFTIEGGAYYEISTTDCAKNKTTKNVSFDIVKGDINKEFKSIEYNLNGGSYTTLSGLNISLNLASGHYSLDVKVTDFAGNVIVKNRTFDIAYTVNLEYEDDHTTATHKVVKGQTYDYLSTLPTTKKAYGVNGMEIRWHPNGTEYSESVRVYGNTVVTNSCTHKLLGLMAMPVDVPSDWTTYCNTLTYNGAKQTLTKSPPTNVTFTSNEGINAGEYTVKAHINAPLYIWKGDWTFDDKEFKCSIGTKSVTVTATDQSKTYDGNALNADASCTITGQVSGHEVTCANNTGSITNVGQTAKGVGNVTIKNGSVDVTSNYKINRTSGNLTVTARTLTVTADAKSKTYGNDNPTFTYTYSGQVSGQTPGFTGSLTTSATSSSNVGSYDITKGSLALADNGTFKKSNYTLSYNKASLTIGKRTITVTAAAKSKTYGDANPSLTYTYSGQVSGQTPGFSGSLTTSAGNTSNVGSYDITQGTLALADNGAFKASNHSISYTKASLSIGKRTIKVTASAKSKTYGDSNPSFTYTYSGQVSGQTPGFSGALTTSAGNTSNVGSYDITQGTLALADNGAFKASNHSLSYTKASLSIGKRTITVTAVAKSKTYGDANPSLTYNYSGQVSGQTPGFSGSLTTSAGNTSNVGNYDITQGTLALADNGAFKASNHSLSYTKAQLTIGKKTLTVKAENKSKYHTQANPTLTYTYSGQISGQTPGFSGSISTTAGKDSAIGTYPITQGTLALADNGAFKASNYSISFTNGTLTINSPCGSTYDSPSCGSYGSCSVTYSQQTGTKTRSCTHKYYSNYVSGYLCSTGTTYNDSASCNGASNGCASTYDSPSCGNYGSCSVTYSQQTGTKTRSCTHKYYSNYISGYLCSTGTTYNDSASCNGTSNGCASTYDSPSCGSYGSCSVTYSQQTGTKTRSCTHKYYSNYISGYLCSTGTTYNDSASCNGSTDACASANLYDSPECGGWSTCPVTCLGQSSTQSRTCTHKYYTNKISGYLCSTGASYTDSVTCTGYQDCCPSGQSWKNGSCQCNGSKCLTCTCVCKNGNVTEKWGKSNCSFNQHDDCLKHCKGQGGYTNQCASKGGYANGGANASCG